MANLSIIDLSLLNTDGGKYSLIREIDRALRKTGAFHLTGIEEYNEAEFFKWTKWFFELSQKKKIKLEGRHDNTDTTPAGYFHIKSDKSTPKEAFGIRCIANTENGVDNPCFEGTPWPDSNAFRTSMENNHGAYLKTMRLMMSLIGQAASMDKNTWQALVELAGNSGLKIFKDLSSPPADGGDGPIYTIPFSINPSSTILTLCTNFSSSAKPQRDRNSSIQDGIIVCAGPVLESLTNGRYPHSQLWLTDRYHAEMHLNSKLDQPIKDDHLVLPLSDTLQIKSPATVWSIDTSPLETKKDLEASSEDIFIDTTGKHKISVLSLEIKESFCSMLTEVLFPFLMAGMGVVGAGLVLDIVQHWDVFQNVGTIFIMIPALLGLKGNLEMTLASRLSTQANLGHMDKKSEILLLAKTNMALVQVQAIVVGLFASLVAIIMGFSTGEVLDFNDCMLITVSAITTASTASFALGVIMMAVIYLSHKFNLNPDNVATPVAASLGDLITLGLLTAFASIFFDIHDKHNWVSPLLIVLFLLTLPIFIRISLKHVQTTEVLKYGWGPILGAMLISSAGGLILDQFIHRFDAFAVFQPVISGIGGNLVAVQASRISTWLHRYGILGHVPEKAGPVCTTPWSIYCKSGPHRVSACALLLLIMPGQLIFAIAIKYLKADEEFDVDFIFILLYVFGSFVQVCFLLFPLIKSVSLFVSSLRICGVAEGQIFLKRVEPT
ncbi:hypothetical protein QYM36_009757 [Artemia franciscana]|uniref:Uncharacterized protein n=1 Tax=Artemia franciscana TaxID=6661 RepID=A0AA88L038_ARTSF|nr:hypothetical protein QYM36_009757 [Artemia franciscana]